MWTSTSALHLGGESGRAAHADLALLVDSNGKPYIPGTGIAGSARSLLTMESIDYRLYRKNQEPPEVQWLFGKDWNRGSDGASYASALTFYDARLAEGSASRISIRDGVRIDEATGTADDGAKFNLEVLPAGTKFVLRCALARHAELSDGVSWNAVFDAFLRMLRAIQNGTLRLGARTRKGYGCGRVEDGWKAYRLDMSRKADILHWVAGEPEKGQALSIDQNAAEAPRKDWFTIDALMQPRSSMLVRQAGSDARDPDFVQLSEGGACVLPGTSLAGVLRHRCRRIAKTLGWPDLETKMTSLFGPLDAGDSAKLRAGRFWVNECRLGTGKRYQQGRVAIDRFTGGALEAQLFDEGAFWPEGESLVKVRLAVEHPRDCEMGLLLLAFKDLWLGDLPVGGESSVGRGILKGRSACFTLPDGHQVRWKLKTSGVVDTDAAEIEVESGELSWLETLVTGMDASQREWQPAEWEQETQEAIA